MLVKKHVPGRGGGFVLGLFIASLWYGLPVVEGVHGVPSPAPATAATRGVDEAIGSKARELDLLESSQPRDGISVFLEGTEKPEKDLLLAVVAIRRHLSGIELELRVGEEIVFPRQRVGFFAAGPSGMSICRITLKRPVATRREDISDDGDGFLPVRVTFLGGMLK